MRAYKSKTMKALIVSEDPEFIFRAQEMMHGRCKVVGCLGPVNTPCPLETEGRCSLAESADVVIVDAPSGVFSHRSTSSPAGPYAGHLRAACPESLVVLESPDFVAGATGGTAHVSDRKHALALLKALAPIWGSVDVPSHPTKHDATQGGDRIGQNRSNSS